VLYVRDLDRSVEFYQSVFGFEVVTRLRNFAAFLRAAGTDNHHDLGLFAVGPDAPRAPRGSTGLYHLAWEVPTIEDLAVAADVLRDAGALGGTSDHGVSKSLYGADPDGNEFEIMWRVPREQWGELEKEAVVAPLDLEEELRRHGTPSGSA
jgi:catechol-2,3-dioxygenase